MAVTASEAGDFETLLIPGSYSLRGFGALPCEFEDSAAGSCGYAASSECGFVKRVHHPNCALRHNRETCRTTFPSATRIPTVRPMAFRGAVVFDRLVRNWVAAASEEPEQATNVSPRFGEADHVANLVHLDHDHNSHRPNYKRRFGGNQRFSARTPTQ